MASTFKWKDSPKEHQDTLTILISYIVFIFGALNVIYQNFGMIIYLFLQDEPATMREVAEIGGILGLTLVGVFKMCIIYWHKDRIHALLEEFKSLVSKDNKRSYEVFYAQHFAQRSHRVMKYTMVFFIFAFIYYNLLPIVIFAYETVMPDLEFQYRLQSFTWYPWQNHHNRKSIISFIAMYICQMFSSLTGVAFIIAGECLLSFFVTQIQMHFEYLAQTIENLDASRTESNDILKGLLNYHNRLLDLAKEINYIFNISFLVNFITATIAICLMGFSMIMISPAHAIKYVVGLTSFLIFAFLICYNGNEFTESSNKLMPAAFYNNWYDGNRAYRKMILIFIIRSKETNYLRAYKFNTVSMETYMAILKMSYQLFTFFKAIG